MERLFDITFKGTRELLKLAENREKLLYENVAAAVAETTLYGIMLIANDTPVDTGRLRASIAGDYAMMAGIMLSRGKISEGKAQSRTKIDWRTLEGRIGTNVEYALDVEFGHKTGGPRKLTAKQIRFLFATGILKAVKGKVIPTNVHSRINRRAGTDRGRVKGKGYFRKNLPLINNFFQKKMQEAIIATSQDRKLGHGVA